LSQPNCQRTFQLSDVTTASQQLQPRHAILLILGHASTPTTKVFFSWPRDSSQSIAAAMVTNRELPVGAIQFPSFPALSFAPAEGYLRNGQPIDETPSENDFRRFAPRLTSKRRGGTLAGLSSSCTLILTAMPQWSRPSFQLLRDHRTAQGPSEPWSWMALAESRPDGTMRVLDEAVAQSVEQRTFNP
jgi:hypothetical protein